MAAEALRIGCAGAHHGRRHVPAMAGEASHRGLVSERGYAGSDYTIFRNGAVPPIIVLRNGIYSPARIMVISEPLRGRGLLGKLCTPMGMARGEFLVFLRPCICLVVCLFFLFFLTL